MQTPEALLFCLLFYKRESFPEGEKEVLEISVGCEND